MEELIPLLILIATGIISLFSSAKKQKRNTTEPESFDSEAESAGMDTDQPANNLTADQDTWLKDWFNESSDKENQPIYEEDDDEEVTGKETKKEPEKPVFETSRKTPEETLEADDLTKKKPARARVKKQPKSKIEMIRDRFDVEEAIIYSEIINRKYF